jgi:hypothetical protein
MSRQRCVFTVFAALLAGLFMRSVARAYDDQVSVDLALGYAALVDVEPLPTNQMSLDVGAGVGVADWLVMRTALGYGLLVDSKHDLQQAVRFRLEGGYLIDVLQWVPFFGLGGGLWALEGSGGFAMRPTGHLWVGVDYLATRRWSVGCDLRFGMLWLHDDNRSFTEGQLRISRVFDVFR